MSVCPYCASDNIFYFMGSYWACADCNETWKPLDALEREGC